jgi:hypothetical protein
MGRYSPQDCATDPDYEEQDFDSYALVSCWLIFDTTLGLKLFETEEKTFEFSDVELDWNAIGMEVYKLFLGYGSLRENYTRARG